MGMREAARKLGRLDEQGREQPFYYSRCWERQRTTGPERLCIAPRSNQIELLEKLSEEFKGPFGVLYVLVVPRGSGAAGRYQHSVPMERTVLKSFLGRYRQFLELDSRHHLWVADVSSDDQLIYDRHNLIYAYGNLPHYEGVLRAEGLRERQVVVPAPHVHHYHSEFDEDERSILEEYEWIFSPLRPQDDD